MAVLPRAEIDVAPSLVVSLLAGQHPDLAHLPVRLAGSGWDNTLFRLGEDLVVRLPRRQVADSLMVAEQRWLPALTAELSVPTSAPVRLGLPGPGFPWHWSVCPWIDGVGGTAVPRVDRTQAARALALFLTEFHRPAPADAPVSPVGRGGPLAARDAVVRARLAALPATPFLPLEPLLAVWDAAVAAPPWSGEPFWLHGDLHPGNVVLTPTGALAGVVDFGDLCAGDPATDLAAAWLHFDADGRAAFSTAYGQRWPDPATWTRARGWALSIGSAMLASSDDAPELRALGVEILAAVLED
jgi:aminoglycoside phosphotransferase (APT) family kinase protein